MTLNRKLALIAGLYFVEGFPMGIYSDVWPQLLKDAGVPREVIGRLSVLGLAWSLKALWAPFVDRLGEWRHWIAGALTVMAATMALVPQISGPGAAVGLIAALAAFCVASATQDVAIDATAVAMTSAGEEGPLSTARVTAYRIGKLAFGSGGLLLAHALGWGAVNALLVPAVVLFALCALALPRVQAAPASAPPAWSTALASWRRPGLAGAVAFLVVYRLGDLAMGPMIGLFQRDVGISLAEMGLYTTALSAGAGIVGGGIGGLLVARSSLPVALAIGAVLSVVSNLGYAAVAFSGGSFPAVIAASLSESFCGGVANVALVSLLVGACDRAHAGVQFALLTAFSPLAGRLVGSISGDVVNAFGYGAWFALTGGFTLPALLWVPAAVRWARGAR